MSTRDPVTPNSNLITCSISISLASFFRKYRVFCSVKTVEVEMDCYLKLVGGGF